MSTPAKYGIDAERRAAIERDGERLIEEAVAAADRRPVVAERLPGHADARREAPLRRVVEQRRARA